MFLAQAFDESHQVGNFAIGQDFFKCWHGDLAIGSDLALANLLLDFFVGDFALSQVFHAEFSGHRCVGLAVQAVTASAVFVEQVTGSLGLFGADKKLLADSQEEAGERQEKPGPAVRAKGSAKSRGMNLEAAVHTADGS